MGGITTKPKFLMPTAGREVHHLMRRLSKAAKYGSLFEQLANETTDDRTALEAEVPPWLSFIPSFLHRHHVKLPRGPRTTPKLFTSQSKLLQHALYLQPSPGLPPYFAGPSHHLFRRH